jgi:anti-sigma B factor antagonist
MEIIQRTLGDVTILDLNGRFVEEKGADFRETMDRLVKSGRRKVLLNFEGVTYMDSAGLGILVAKFVTLNKKDGKLKLCNLHRPSFRVLDVTRLLTIFESFDSESAALASFGDPPETVF